MAVLFVVQKGWGRPVLFALNERECDEEQTMSYRGRRAVVETVVIKYCLRRVSLIQIEPRSCSHQCVNDLAMNLV